MIKRERFEKAAPRRQQSAPKTSGGAALPAFKPMQDLGVAGTAVFGGIIQQKDVSNLWRGSARYTLVSEIVSNVSIVAASIRHYMNLATHPAWKVVPVSDTDPEAKELAEFVDEVLFDMDTTMSSLVRSTTSYLFHGFSFQEWRAKKRQDGRIGFQHVKPRPQHTVERWSVDESGEVLGVFQRSPQTGRLIGLPRGKLVYAVDHTFTDAPDGFGIFRQLVEPHNRLKKLLSLEVSVFERDLRGIPIGRAPLSKLREAVSNGIVKQADADRCVNSLREFLEMQSKDNDTSLLLDSQPYESQASDGDKVSSVMQWSLDLLQGGANGLADLAKAIDRIQREIARIISTEHLMLGDQGGNRALATDKSRNLYLTLNSSLSDMAAVYDRDLITPLWLLNGLPEDKKPWLSVEEVSFRDVEQMGAALRDMATAGAVLAPDDPAIGEMRDLLGLSRPDPVDNLVVMPVGRDQLDEDSDMDTDQGVDQDLDEDMPED
jgi:hypothetical protein